MKIDRGEARRIAALAHLEFDEAGLDRMAAEMTAILEYIDQLKNVVEDSGPPLSRTAEGGGLPLRDDIVRPGVAIEDVERNAPSYE